MIEQTELIVTDWYYHEPENPPSEDEKIFNTVELDVMQKRAGTKKGLACRFTCIFKTETQTILRYVTEDSYVIDLTDKIDKRELLTMIRNSYSKFKDRFELRKFGTVLKDKSLSPLNENIMDLDAIIPLLE